MSLFSEALRRVWMPGIAARKAPASLYIGTWLEQPNYYVTEVAGPDQFVLTLPDVAEADTLFAAIANKTLSACFETILSILQVEKSPRSLAWSLVKLYYASYFAAHSFMRMCGAGCVNLDAVDTARVLDGARALGVAGSINKIVSGLYSLRFDATKGTLTFSSLNTKASHEALWSSFLVFLDDLVQRAEAILPVQVQREAFNERLADIRAILCLEGANGGNWLSRVRNNVQYRQGYGAWYPYSLGRRLPTSILTNVDTLFTQDPGTIPLTVGIKTPTGKIDTFAAGCLFLASVSRSVAVSMGNTATDPRSLVRTGSLFLLKKAKLSRSND